MPDVFKAITRLIYYSNGGFGFQELYSETPVYVRNFLVREIENIKKKEKEQVEEGKSSSGASTKASSEDIGKAMEQLQKESGKEQADEDVLDKVFGDERKEKSRNRTGERRQPQQQPPQKQQQQPEPSKKQEQPEEKEGDPAKAEDLEQMIDKLKGDM